MRKSTFLKASLNFFFIVKNTIFSRAFQLSEKEASYLEERIKRTGKKEQPAPTEKRPLKTKERSSNEKSKTAKEPASSIAKSVDATDAPKPDLAALKAMVRPQ